MIGLSCQGADHAAEAAVQLLGDRLTGTGGEVQLLQQISEQWQGVVRTGVVDDGLHDTGREGQANKSARPLDHLGELTPAERADGDRVLEEIGVARGKERSQEVHAQCGKYPDPRIARHTGVQDIEELGALPFAGESDKLFELVDHDEHATEPAPAQPRQLRKQ